MSNNNGHSNGNGKTGNHKIDVCADELIGLYGKLHLFGDKNCALLDICPIDNDKIRVESKQSVLELNDDDWFSIRLRSGHMSLLHGPTRFRSPYLKITSMSVIERKRVHTNFNDQINLMPWQAAVCYDGARPDGMKWAAIPGLFRKGDGKAYPNSIIGQEIIIVINARSKYVANDKPLVEAIYVRSFVKNPAKGALKKILEQNGLMRTEQRSGAFEEAQKSFTNDLVNEMSMSAY